MTTIRFTSLFILETSIIRYMKYTLIENFIKGIFYMILQIFILQYILSQTI